MELNQINILSQVFLKSQVIKREVVQNARYVERKTATLKNEKNKLGLEKF